MQTRAIASGVVPHFRLGLSVTLIGFFSEAGVDPWSRRFGKLRRPR